jgi:hypothetical protein
LCEAAWIGVRRDPFLKARLERIMNDDPDRKKIAIVAIAHHLCRVMAAMLRSGQRWRRGTGKEDGLRPAVEGTPLRKTPLQKAAIF